MRSKGNVHLSSLSGGKRERGIALITTLLIMTLLIAMTLGMTIAVTSDTLISRYYRNFRSSFYAADSGTNIVRQYMANQLVAAIPSTFSNTTQPIPSTEAATVQTNILSNYGSTASASNLLVTQGNAANSWRGSFYIASSPGPALTLTSCTPLYTGTPTNAGPYTCTNIPTCSGCAAAAFNLYEFQYVYNYTYTSMGQSLASEQAQVQDAGTININVNVAPEAGQTTSFAAWGMFIATSPICNGTTLVGGTISGPVFTNGAWNFGTTSYTFTDSVGSASADFGYQFSNQCNQTATGSDSQSGATIAPTFESGYKLGQNTLPLPANSYSQEWAVLNGLGTETTSPTAAQMNSDLRNYADAAYPTTAPSSGVYMGYSSTTVGGVTTNTMTGGGIYVQGNADSVVLTAASATAANNPVSGVAANDSLQEVTVTQGATTTTVYEDLTNQMTYMKQGTTVTSIHGLPQNYNTSPATPSTMLYVNGNIGTSTTNGLSGPGQGLGAIQSTAPSGGIGEEMTVAAAGNINITGDILYSKEPINTPADTINTTNNSDQVLGIFTANGNIQLYNQQSNGNLEIDAALATISATGSGALINNGNSINTLTIIGGRIQNTIQNIGTTTRNVWFDRRFSQGNFAPPWFPSTTVTPLATDTATGATTTFTRTSWTAPNQ